MSVIEQEKAESMDWYWCRGKKVLIVEVEYDNFSEQLDVSPIVSTVKKFRNNSSFTIPPFKKVMLSVGGILDGETLDLQDFWGDSTKIFFYKLVTIPPMVLDGGGDGHLSDETSTFASRWTLPHKEFDDIWENLIFEQKIKDELLNYVSAMMLCSERGASRNIVSCNKMVLLHGPPGTGKTTLCKGLAQRLAIRTTENKFGGNAIFLEINSHSLFSRFFSESGKLVQRLFSEIQILLTRNPNTMLIVLVDEIESLAISRETSERKQEPSDGLRAVNALLTQLDTIKNWPNVLIVTTSNMYGSIDEAFLSRVDVKIQIPLPGPKAIYTILSDIVREFQRIDIVREEKSAEWMETEMKLIAKLCAKNDEDGAQGLSGRILRKVPVSALASIMEVEEPPFDLSHFIAALTSAVKKYKKSELPLMD